MPKLNLISKKFTKLEVITPAANRRKRTNETHGMSETPEYTIWLGIKQRCLNPNNDWYHCYGGRGIIICDQWRDSFTTFLRDMGPRPSPEHEVDRRENDKSYSPENCRWATRKEQTRNTRQNTKLTFEGKTLTMVEWSIISGIRTGIISKRLKLGWTTEEIFSTPVRKHGNLKPQDIPEIRRRLKAGECHSAIAADFNVSRATITHIGLNKIWKHIS